MSNTDKNQAQGFRDLETQVHDVMRAACLLNIVTSETLLEPNEFIEDLIRSKVKLDGMTIYVLSEREAHALEYAIDHLHELCTKLEQSYQAAWGGSAAVAPPARKRGGSLRNAA